MVKASNPSHRGRLLMPSSGSTPTSSYPEAFYAHNHKTPERSNRQRSKQQPPSTTTGPGTPPTEPNTPEEAEPPGRPAGRPIGRLRPHRLNLFASSNSNNNNNSSTATSVSKRQPQEPPASRSNADSGPSQYPQHQHQHQPQKQQQPQNPSRSIAASLQAASTTPQSQSQPQAQHHSHAEAAAKPASQVPSNSKKNAIPESHINIITQAYGHQADIYKDVLQIPRSMLSEREIRIAYFRRGRQVLAEKPPNGAPTSNVSQLAKLKFQAVSMAYEILSNPAWKEVYHRYGLHGDGSFFESPGEGTAAENNIMQEADDHHHQQQQQNHHYPSTTQHQNNNNNNNNNSNNQKSSKPPKKPILSHTPSTLPGAFNRSATNTANHNRMDADNVSQSTAGTGTSSVLRKAGSFLEKCKLKHKKAQLQGPWNSNTSNNNNNNATSSVRWNEEVEELIFRQDPEEVSFKARVLEEEESSDGDEDDGEYDDDACDDNVKNDSSGRTGYQHNNNNNNNRSSNGANANAYPSQQQQQQPQQQQRVYEHPTSHTDSTKHSNRNAIVTRSHGRLTANGASNGVGGKQKKRVVLDTAELGSHLEKLDKVADSIAGIFDELEASFDGFLGMGSKEKQQHQQQRQQGRHPYQNLNDNSNIAQAPERALSPVEGDSEFAIQPQQPLGESSYHTPPVSVGSGHRVEHQEHYQRLPSPQEQQMGFYGVSDEPPSDVLVKNRSKKHLVQVDGASELALLAEHEQQQLTLDHEALSACDTDMAAAISLAETATVGTSISLLDPQKHSQTALKPAASTSTIAKAQRKRLRNVQRRRLQQQHQAQQQRATDQQQQKEKESRGDLNNTNSNINNDVRKAQSGEKQPQRSKASDHETPPDHDKKAKKKNSGGEDDYFENLYQNFFALPKERLPNEMTIRTRPPRSSCSVSTISHSIATAQDSTINLDFNPWDLANSAWPVLGEDDEESKHNKDVISRLDSMVAQRSSNGADFSFDSSFPESFGLNTTMDSGTAVDTSFDSSAVDSAFRSALKPRDQKVSAGKGCNDPAEILNQVFDVRLEDPLQFWCGDVDNCAASTDASMRHKKKLLQQRSRKISSRYKRSDSSSSNDDTSIAASSIKDVEEEETEPRTDESETLMDPPTHDSRVLDTDFDDSTMDSFNTNRQEEENDDGDDDDEEGENNEDEENDDEGEDDASVVVEEERPKSALAGCSPAAEASSANEEGNTIRSPSPVQLETEMDDDNCEDGDAGTDSTEDMKENEGRQGQVNTGKLQQPLPLVDVESASRSQLLEVISPTSYQAPEVFEVETASVATEADAMEDREDISCVTLEVLSVRPDAASEYDYESKDEDISPAHSSYSSHRGGMDSAATTWEEEEEQEYADAYYAGDVVSVATSVSSAVSRSKANESSFMNYLMTYLQRAMKANAEVPTLASIQSHLNYGLESWRATNNACCDAIIISDDDMAGMLDVLEHEMKRPTPDFASETTE